MNWQTVTVSLTHRQVTALVEDYNRLHYGGGSYHIVLGDGNVEDHHVHGALRDAIGDGEVLGEVLMFALLQMTVAERKQVVFAAEREDGE